MAAFQIIQGHNTLAFSYSLTPVDSAFSDGAFSHPGVDLQAPRFESPRLQIPSPVLPFQVKFKKPCKACSDFVSLWLSHNVLLAGKLCWVINTCWTWDQC